MVQTIVVINICCGSQFASASSLLGFEGVTISHLMDIEKSHELHKEGVTRLLCLWNMRQNKASCKRKAGKLDLAKHLLCTFLYNFMCAHTS